MSNEDVASALSEIAELYELLGVEWKPRAFQKAARQISALQNDVYSLYQKGGKKELEKIEGIGSSISEMIEEFLTKARISELDELKSQIPPGLVEMLRIPGVGPKRAMRLYKELRIDCIDRLEDMAKRGELRKLEGFGEKSEAEIIKGIEFLRRGSDRKLLGDVLPIAKKIAYDISNMDGVEQVEIAGSVRRMKETCKDIDILVISSKPQQVSDEFVLLPDVAQVIAKGDTKTTVLLKAGLNCDIRIIPKESFGAALQYFTGNKDHNVELRKVAQSRGYKLSEYGLFNLRTEKMIAGKTEEDVYSVLGFPYIEPELRENQGELRLQKSPDLIDYDTILGDLHIHTKWSDGLNTTEEVVRHAIQLGYEYIAITDHSVSEKIQNGLDSKRVKEHFEEIDRLQKKYPSIKIFKGAEVDILKDGKLDYPDEILKLMDIVVASVHIRFKMERDDMTMRICKAIENPHTTIIGHLTGRLINTRPGYDVDFDMICDHARKHNVAVEINSQPSRLDINDSMVRHAVAEGVKLAINTDAHSLNEFDFIEYGIAQARRGWASKTDVINTLTAKELSSWLEKRKK